MKGHDALLKPYLDEYRDTFEEEGVRLDEFIRDLDHYTDTSLILKLKWQLKLRTRLKSFLFRLAEKI
jgi:hypothetical protein